MRLGIYMGLSGNIGARLKEPKIEKSQGGIGRLERRARDPELPALARALQPRTLREVSHSSGHWVRNERPEETKTPQ